MYVYEVIDYEECTSFLENGAKGILYFFVGKIVNLGCCLFTYCYQRLPMVSGIMKDGKAKYSKSITQSRRMSVW